jgi:hypothetical protein
MLANFEKSTLLMGPRGWAVIAAVISAVIATFLCRSVKLRSRVLLANQLGAGSGESKHLF